MSAPTTSLAALDEHLAAVIDELSTPPADRDPVLWAAHEAALCARALIALRSGGSEADWASVLAPVRAAMTAVSYARREAGTQHAS